MMFFQRVALFSAIAVVSVGSGPVQAQGENVGPGNFAPHPQPALMAQGGPGGGPGQGDMPRGLIEKLDLTNEQLLQLQDLRGAHMDDRQGNQEAIKAAHDQLRTLMADPNTTAEALRSQHQQISQLKQAMADERFENMLQMWEILTPSQRVTFSESMGRGDGPGQGGPGGRGHQSGDRGERPGPGGRGNQNGNQGIGFGAGGRDR